MINTFRSLRYSPAGPGRIFGLNLPPYDLDESYYYDDEDDDVDNDVDEDDDDDDNYNHCYYYYY